MLTLATSYPFLNTLWTILIFMALVIWYRIEAPMERAKGLAHVLWLATRQIELAVASAESSTTYIAPDSNGEGSRFARNPGSHEVDVRGSFRKGASRIGSQRATSCRPPASGRLGKSFHPVGVMARAACARGIADHPLRWRTEVSPC